MGDNAEFKGVWRAPADSMAQVERAKQEWESTADSLSQLICLLDREGRIIRANRTVEEWGLCSIQDIAGRYVHELFHSGCVGADCEFSVFWRRAWEGLRDGQASGYEYEDQILGRFLSIQVRPISTQKVADSAETTSFAVVVVDDITERKKAERALRQRTIELQTRNDELDAFAHTVAHDLKNLVSLIMGYADIVKHFRATMSETDMDGHLDDIIHNAFKTNNIIDELLLLSGVRRIEVTPAPVEMGSVVDEALQRLSVMIDESGVEVVLADAWPMAMGYAPWLEEVWVNYVSNAIKYGGHPPRIELGSMPQRDGTVRFWVRDNGHGLTAEEQSHLFQPSTRLEQHRVTGYGLGLSIVRRIVEKLGGRVGVQSDLGRGSEFSFVLLAGSASQD